jgi:hypothetical protein
MALMVLALPHIAATRIYSWGLPNAYNFGFDYGLFVKVRAWRQQALFGGSAAAWERWVHWCGGAGR